MGEAGRHAEDVYGSWIMIKSEWYCCPNCGRKLFKVEPDAMAKGISIKCKGTKDQKCGRVVHVKIKN